MENVKSEICFFGATGFIGQNLIKEFPCAHSVSIREIDWHKKVSGSKIWVNLIGKAHDHKKEFTKQDYFYVNFELVKEIFNRFISSEAELFIHISSIASLEEFEAKSALKEDGECNPVSWYGCSKRAAEIWLLEQSVPASKKIIILRPPMVHGAGDKGNLRLLFNLLVKRIPYPLTSFNNKRSFISMDNFVFFLQQIFEKNSSLSSGIYHIADDESVSTNEIVDIIKDITGKKSANVSIPKFIIETIARFGDIFPIPLNSMKLRKMTSDLLVSNSKLKSTLGIQKLPFTARDGLIKTIKSFE